MQIHDLRCKILREVHDTPIKSNFPLKLGDLELELEKSYHINSKKKI